MIFEKVKCDKLFNLYLWNILWSIPDDFGPEPEVPRKAVEIEWYTYFSDEVTEGLRNVRVEEKRVEGGGWMVNSWPR